MNDEDFKPGNIIKYKNVYLKVKIQDSCDNCFFINGFGCDLPDENECFYYGGWKIPIIFEEMSPIEAMVLMEEKNGA